MRSGLIYSALAAFALTAPGCILSELDLTGKACPCDSPYTCDLETNTCVRADSSADGAVTVDEDGGPSRDAETEGDGGMEPVDGAMTFPDAAGIPDTCTLDSECNDAAYICEQMTCVRRCGELGGMQCGMDEVCNPNNGRCIIANLAIGTDCTINGQCSSGYCLNVTTSSTAGNQKFCSVPCSSTTDCPIETSCLNLGGIAFCMRETSFAPPGNFDTPPGGMCESAGNTCQSRTCNLDELTCIQRCTRESDCEGYGKNCWTWAEGSYAGICFNPNGANTPIGSGCAMDAQCRTGVCNRYQGACAAHCCTESDCGMAETCAVYDLAPDVPVKICRPKSGTGTAGLGASCTANADCESELCVAANVDGTGAKKCSVTCCEPSDCTALPNGGLCWPVQGVLQGTLIGHCLPQ